MITETLAYNLQLEEQEIDRLLSFGSHNVVHDDVFAHLLHQIDVDTLRQSMVEARECLDQHLPSLVEDAMERHNLSHFPLSGYMLCNWVVGFLTYSSEDLSQLYNIHRPIPQLVIQDVVPDILTIFDQMDESVPEWKQAFATVVIPILCST